MARSDGQGMAESRQEFRFYSIDIEDMIDRAFSKASEAAESQNVSGLRPRVKARIKEKKRIRVAAGTIDRHLTRLQKQIPGKKQVSPFHKDMLKAMGAMPIFGAKNEVMDVSSSIRRIRDKTLRKMDSARNSSSLYRFRTRAYGRISSYCRSLKPVMDFLDEIAPKMREMPTIKFDLPTIVIAGCPNVGKTTLLTVLTGSDPEVKPVPFTTQRIQLGYYQEGWKKIQVIDTPGLLDRPLEERNESEMKAVEAMEHLADLVIFIIDPTTRSGFVLADQLNLLRQILELFQNPVIVAINKIDIAGEDQIAEVESSLREGLPVFTISCVDMVGIPDLQDQISTYLRDLDF